jgi:hypothetical protein
LSSTVRWWKHARGMSCRRSEYAGIAGPMKPARWRASSLRYRSTWRPQLARHQESRCSSYGPCHIH